MGYSQNNTSPIGIFDSGVGGLTVANAVVRLLPQEDIIYFGDTAHLPYGDKSADTIRIYSERITRFLIEKGCKAIIIACNSASATAYQYLQEQFGHLIPIFNVIDPLVAEVAEQDYKRVGVIATKATIRSGIYNTRMAELNPITQVSTLATPLLVPMIEEGYFENKISHTIIENYLSHPALDGVEALMLCCTHYPLIRAEIETFYNGRIKVYDNSEAVAESIKEFLTENRLLNNKENTHHQFYVSDYTRSFEQTTQLFYGKEVKLEEQDLGK